MTPEMRMKVEVWRQKALRNELSTEEMIEAVAFMRLSRGKAYTPPSKTKASKAITSVDTKSLLESL